MPETPANPSDPSPSGAPAPGGSTPASGATPAPPAEWKAPANHPIEAFRGKTGAEILVMSEQLVSAVQQAGAGQPADAKPPALPTDDDFLIRPSDAVARIADARMTAAMGPALEGMRALAAQNAVTIKSLAEQRFASEFGKWRGEIEGHMAKVPAEARTLDVWEQAVTLVRGAHVKDLAAEMAQQLVAGGGLGERSGGGSGVGVPGIGGLDLSKLPPETKVAMERAGLTETDVREFCKKNNWTVEKWVQEMSNGKVFTQISPFSHQMSEAALGVTRQFEG